jgi:hypothetical protein
MGNILPSNLSGNPAQSTPQVDGGAAARPHSQAFHAIAKLCQGDDAYENAILVG